MRHTLPPLDERYELTFKVPHGTITGVGSHTVRATVRRIGTNHEEESDEYGTVRVVKVEVFRDSGYTNVLDDWPENGGMRSPKYVFGKDDPIYVQVRGLGKDRFVAETSTRAVQVFSDSDTTGDIYLDLKETGKATQIFRNSLAVGELLYLADSSSSTGSGDYIKVVDEEVLTFKLRCPLIDPLSSYEDSCDVMVDRGEYAACAIQEAKFLGEEFKRQMELPRVNWWQAGYEEYADDIGDSTKWPTEPMKHFIRNAGENDPDRLEADFQFHACHGEENGNLIDKYDNMILNPQIDIDNNSDWNDDVEWGWSFACNTLDRFEGRAYWDDALFGDDRPAHMVLGFHDNMPGGAKAGLITAFFNKATGSPPYTIVNAYHYAGTLGVHPDQNIAIVEHKDNDDDKLKEVTRDTDSTSMRYYYYNTITEEWIPIDYTWTPLSNGTENPKTESHKDYRSYGRCKVKVTGALPKGLRPTLAPLEAELLLLKKVPKGFEHLRLVWGLEVFDKPFAHHDLVAQDEEKASQIANLVLEGLFGQMPESDPLVRRIGIFYGTDFRRGEEPNLSGAIPLLRDIGYSHYHNGIHIIGDILSAGVAHDDIVKVRACWHEVVGEPGEKKVKIVEAEDCLGVAVNNLAQEFPEEKEPEFELRKTKLCYYGFHEAGKARKCFVPAWRFTFQKDGKYYNQYVGAQSNIALNAKADIAKAMREFRE